MPKSLNLTAEEKLIRKREAEKRYRAKKGPKTGKEKEYHSQYMKEWYVRNRERIKDKSKEKYWADPEKNKENAKKWSREHREIVNKRNLAYFQKRRAAMTEEELEAYKAYKREYNKQRRARIMANSGGKIVPKPLTAEQKYQHKEYARQWAKENRALIYARRKEKIAAMSDQERKAYLEKRNEQLRQYRKKYRAKKRVTARRIKEKINYMKQIQWRSVNTP